MTRVLLLLGVLFSVVVHAASPMDEYARLLEQELQGRTHALSTQITTFHWTTLDPLDGKSPGQRLSWAKKNASLFWGRLKESDAGGPGNNGIDAGKGLYVAGDPLSSEHYAREVWGLLSVNLRAGTRYVDLISRFSNATQDAASRAGCRPLMLLRDWYKGDCVALAKKILKRLGVQVVLYLPGGLNLTGCERPVGHFFNIIEGSAIESTEFSSSERMGGNAREVRTLISLARGESSRFPVWNGTSVEPLRQQNEAKLLSRVFGCK